MSGMRELSLNEIVKVSGGESWATEQLHERLSGGYDFSHGAPKTTAASVLGGQTAFAVAHAGISSAQADNNRRGGGWHDTNPGGAIGQCRW